jgi:hypothetical protein
MKRSTFILATCLLIGCTDLGTNVDGTPLGYFAYTGYESTNVAIDRGWLYLTIKDEAMTEPPGISGRWSLKNSGSGDLAGSLVNDTVWINLHPQFKDHNLILVGRLEGKRYWGIWQWIGFAGVMSKGTFVAIRQ